MYYPLNSFVENFWEFNFYLGIIGFVFLIYFGLFKWLKETPPRWKELILPVFVLIALSIGSTYWIVRLTGIPLFASERAAMRMISVPVVWLILIGCITFQEWWNGKKFEMSHQIVALMTLVLMFIDLWSNLKAWRPSEIRQYFTPITMTVTGNLVANHTDPQYFMVLGIGLSITLITGIFLITMAWRETRLKRKTI
jgi:hypothetical protein